MEKIGFVLVLILFIIFGPMATIWALNLLFGFAIPTNLATWFAVLWLCGIFAPKYS